MLYVCLRLKPSNVFFPHLTSLLFIYHFGLLWTFFQSGIYLVFMFFFTIILVFDQKITCCLLISTFLRKYKDLGTLKHTKHYNTVLTYMLFYVCFNYFYTLNSHFHHCTIYIYIYENLQITLLLKNYLPLLFVYFLPISSYFTPNYLVLINITHDHGFNRWIAGIQLLTND